MKSEQTSANTERRKSIDFWFYLARAVAICSWIAFLIAINVSYFVAPETDYGYLRYRDIEIRQFWLTPLTGYLYLIIWFSAASSYTAILIDKYRSRRRYDNSSTNLYLLLVINLIWLSVILHHVLKAANVIG
jgi:hypothetical protein